MFLVILLLAMLVGAAAILALLRGLVVLALQLAGVALVVLAMQGVPPAWRNAGIIVLAVAGVALWIFVALAPRPVSAMERADLEYCVKRRRAERAACGETTLPAGAPITDEEIQLYRDEVRQLELASKARARVMKART